jgi:large subunit ribosomal protein L24
MLIRKGDIVEVIAGDDAGTAKARTTGRVLRVIAKSNKIVVEGVNKVYKHLRPSRQNPQGGRLSKEMPIAVSNALLYCPSCTRGVRIAKRLADGTKTRVCKKCGHSFGKIGA